MKIRIRLTLRCAVLVVGAATAACGDGGGGSGSGSGAPADASEEEFCAAQSSLVEGLLPEDLTNPEMPSNEDMAQTVKDWAAEIEEVGTPENITDEARAGFEAVVAQAKDIDPADFDMEQLEQLELGGPDASAKVKEQAQAFSDYLTETCGNPMDNLELPELPGSTG